MKYAGFWIRFWAASVDSITLIPISLLVFFKFGMDSFGLFASGGIENGLFGYGVLYFLLGIIIPWVYFSLFESGGWQATPGKRLMGIYVVSSYGEKISFGRATARHFSKILSQLLFYIGYIMVGVTDNKQGLHDKICNTLVLRGKPGDDDSFANYGSNDRYEDTKINLQGGNWVLSGFDDQGHVVRLTFREDDNRFQGQGLVIGRDSKNCDLVINDNSVSRRHARIYKVRDEMWIEDLGSTNGISINRKSLLSNSATQLPVSGDIVIGGVELTLGKY